MSERNKEDLKAFFLAGTKPTEQQFADLIESQVNLVETASFDSASTQLNPASGFLNLSGASAFYGLSGPGANSSYHIGNPAFGDSSSYIKNVNGFHVLMNSGLDTASGPGITPAFSIQTDTGVPGINPAHTLFRIHRYAAQTGSHDTAFEITGDITSSGAISASGAIVAGSITGTSTTFTSITSSGNISSSGNITASGFNASGTSTLNGDITIPKSVKLYFDGPSGLHVYSEGTATDENQVILAKTNNLRIVNQAHGKDIIFGTENASGTAKTPLTLSGSGDAVFSGNITGVTNLTVAGNINANGNIVGDDSTNITNISTIECDAIASDNNNTTKIQLDNVQLVALVNDADVFDVTETLFTHNIPVKFNSTIVGQRLPIKNLTGTSETLTAAESGKLCLFSDADGAIVTLPDSGGGSIVGVYYDFYVSVAATSNVHRINVADTTNEDFEGYLHSIDGDGASSVASVAWRALNSDGFDAISMDGTTTGTIGTAFRITNVAADRWYVTGHIVATGTPATPFVAS